MNLSLTTPRFPEKFPPKVLFGSLPRQTGENQEKKGGTILSNSTGFQLLLDFFVQGRVIFTSIKQDRTKKNAGKYVKTVDGKKPAPVEVGSFQPTI